MTRTSFSPRHVAYLAVPLAAFLLTWSYLTVTSREAQAAQIPAPKKSAAAGATAAPEARLDDKLRDDMMRALNPDAVDIPAALYNPFAERTGPSAPSAQRQGTPLPGVDPRLTPGANGPGAPPHSAPRLQPFEERFREWQRKGRELREAGLRVPPRTSIYSITELEARGTERRPGDRSDSGITGAWLYIKPEGQAFTAPLGTLFLDGRLERVIPEEGAVFQPLDKDGRPKGPTVTIPFPKEK